MRKLLSIVFLFTSLLVCANVAVADEVSGNEVWYCFKISNLSAFKQYKFKVEFEEEARYMEYTKKQKDVVEGDNCPNGNGFLFAVDSKGNISKAKLSVFSKERYAKASSQQTRTFKIIGIEKGEIKLEEVKNNSFPLIGPSFTDTINLLLAVALPLLALLGMFFFIKHRNKFTLMPSLK